MKEATAISLSRGQLKRFSKQVKFSSLLMMMTFYAGANI